MSNAHVRAVTIADSMPGDTTPGLPMLALPGVTFGERSLTLPEGLPYEQWERIGHLLQHMERNVQFWIGDWLRYGERRYGERYSQAIQASTGYQATTLANLAYVASQIEPSRRREIAFGHHQAVASLPPAEQDDLLDQAERGHWTVRETREQARALKGEIPIEPAKTATCPNCGWRL